MALIHGPLAPVYLENTFQVKSIGFRIHLLSTAKAVLFLRGHRNPDLPGDGLCYLAVQRQYIFQREQEGDRPDKF